VFRVAEGNIARYIEQAAKLGKPVTAQLSVTMQYIGEEMVPSAIEYIAEFSDGERWVMSFTN
jgi:hypothetical protein